MEENKMGVMPIGKLIVTMSLPIMISMLVQALYNVVDSVFVARIDEYALTAVSMAFPIQNLMIAVSVGTAVGVNALLARYLGAKDYEKVNKIAENAVFLAIMSYLVFLLVGLFLAEPFYRSQTDIEEIVQYGRQYISICCCLSFGVFIQIMFERLLQATGKTGLYHVYAGSRSAYQYYSGPDPHFWYVWSAAYGSGRSCRSNSCRTDGGSSAGCEFESFEK